MYTQRMCMYVYVCVYLIRAWRASVYVCVNKHIVYMSDFTILCIVWLEVAVVVLLACIRFQTNVIC